MDDPASITDRLNELLTLAGQAILPADQAAQFDLYFALLTRWNTRINLTAIRDQEGILSRHFVESIACARALPADIATLLDFGSGAGLPGIPIAICCPAIAVTLAESQGKKAAFLRETVRTLGLNTQVQSGRAESLTGHFDCVTLRAVDHMDQAVSAATKLVAPDGWLAPLTTDTELPSIQAAAGPAFLWSAAMPTSSGDHRILALGKNRHAH